MSQPANFTRREIDVLRFLGTNRDQEFSPSSVGSGIKVNSKAPSALGGFYLRVLTDRGLITRKDRGRYQINGRGLQVLSRR